MRIAPLLVIATLAACGDNLSGGGPLADAGADASSDAPGGPAATAFAVAPDFQAGSGVASTIGIPSLEVQVNAVAGAASSDPVVRTLGDRLIVVNRFGFDNLTILERADLSLVDQVSTGSGSNPQDVAEANGKLYVAALAAPGILVIDESDLAAGVAKTIDLSALDAEDGIPDCASVIATGGVVVAACQVLDESFQPRGPGQIAIIDPDSDSVETTFALTYANPTSFLVAADRGKPLGADALVATAPSFSDYSSGCIEKIDLGASPGATGCLVDNATLGGYVGTLANHQGSLYATVISCIDGDCFNKPTLASLVAVDAGGGSGTVLSGDSSHITDVAVCPTGQLVAGDTDFGDEPGIRVFTPAGDELTEAPLDIGLAPGFVNSITCY